MSDLLPQNATPQERALAEVVRRLGDVPTVMRELWNPDTIPAVLLPWLAWAFSVDEWDPAWTEDQKRNAVRDAIEVQQIKGTIGAVKRALAAVGINVEVQEWFAQDPQGAEYTFDLHVSGDDQAVTLEGINKAVALVEATKSLRSHLGEIIVSATSEGTGYVGAVSGVGTEINVTGFLLPGLVLNEYAMVIS